MIDLKRPYFESSNLNFTPPGRMFEAPSSVMLTSLDKLAGLDSTTKLWPGKYLF